MVPWVMVPWDDGALGDDALGCWYLGMLVPWVMVLSPNPTLFSPFPNRSFLWSPGSCAMGNAASDQHHEA